MKRTRPSWWLYYLASSVHRPMSTANNDECQVAELLCVGWWKRHAAEDMTWKYAWIYIVISILCFATPYHCKNLTVGSLFLCLQETATNSRAPLSNTTHSIRTNQNQALALENPEINAELKWFGCSLAVVELRDALQTATTSPLAILPYNKKGRDMNRGYLKL